MPCTESTNSASKQVCCDLCGSRHASLLYPSLTRITGYPLSRCLDCGLMLLTPRSPVEIETEFYRSNYYESDHKHAEYLSRIPMFRSYLARIRRLCREGAILDVGCGPAHFLRLAQRQGFDVCGVEVSKSAVAQACLALPGKVHLGALQDVALAPGSFDVATMFNVLDQLPNPLETVVRVFELLKPGGFLLARVPNGSVHHRLKKVLDWFHTAAQRFKLTELTPFHLYQFTPATLAGLYHRAGYSRIQIRNSPLSYGDPSGKAEGLGLVRLKLAKAGYGSFAAVLARTTGMRLLLGTSIDGYAFKDP